MTYEMTSQTPGARLTGCTHVFCDCEFQQLHQKQRSFICLSAGRHAHTHPLTNAITPMSADRRTSSLLIITISNIALVDPQYKSYCLLPSDVNSWARPRATPAVDVTALRHVTSSVTLSRCQTNDKNRPILSADNIGRQKSVVCHQKSADFCRPRKIGR